MKQIKAKIIDHTHLELDQPIEGKPGDVISISIPIEKIDHQIEEPFDITQDPLFKLRGYKSTAPADLSSTIDEHLYGGDQVK